MPPRAVETEPPKASRASSRLKEKTASPRLEKSPKKSRLSSSFRGGKASVEAAVATREAELLAARGELGFFKTPLTIFRLFGAATVEFLASNALALVTSPMAYFVLYPLLVAYGATKLLMPELYTPPDCASVMPGALYMPELYAFEGAWWLVLGILSSIGLGTGLHSGIMFLWPFCMSVILRVESCRSTNFIAMYNHPCNMQCDEREDGSASFFNTLVLLWPSVVLWGSGTAIGELPPYFITRAAKRAGARATDYEDELKEARESTNLVSKLKVYTIDFTERYGFIGILLLASWPNAAFDMCGMACGWLEMPFWTFFGATLLGKGTVKVTMQSLACIAVFGPAFWNAILGITPTVSLPAAMCNGAGLPADGTVACTLPAFLNAGRAKMIHKFTLQQRMLPSALLGGSTKLSAADLVERYCAVQSICGAKASLVLGGSYADTVKYKEMVKVAERVMGAYDTDKDGNLCLSELSQAVGASDGKLSLGSLDPGTGGLLSFGTLWNGLIASLVLFFIYSIVEQVALQTQQTYDGAELQALEEHLTSEAGDPASAKVKGKAKAE